MIEIFRSVQLDLMLVLSGISGAVAFFLALSKSLDKERKLYLILANLFSVLLLISDRAADADQGFTFTVTLGDTSINGTYGGMTFANGIATVTLKGGESVTATGLPTDITYAITEADAEGFQMTGKTGDTGTIV